MYQPRTDIRLALPSKGRLYQDSMDLLERAGLRVYKPNPRQLMATIPDLPEVSVLFQRAGDIVVSVRDGSIDFGITGMDMVSELNHNGNIVTLLPELGFGSCSLNVIVSEAQESLHKMADLVEWQQTLGRPLRVACKFPNLTQSFFKKHGLEAYKLISAEGTLEVAPAIGYADLIVDLVSTGTTVQDNRLRVLQDGLILKSQACLIANKEALKSSPRVLAVARQLVEFIIAHRRAAENVAIFSNIRGDSPEAIARSMFTKTVLGGLQGPTVAPVVTRQPGQTPWYAVTIVVRKNQLAQAISELREIGGSGVFVTPVVYIFEEEPEEYTAMLAALED